MKNTHLQRTVMLLLSGSSMVLGSVSPASAAGLTMYNLYYNNGTTPCAPCSNAATGGTANSAGGYTDGWVWGFGAASPGNASAATPGWAGTASATTAALGYTGNASLNWGARLQSAGDAVEVSNADSLARYGVSADIDTAKGAWFDNATPGQGWKHDLDLGLFKSDVTQTVTLSVRGVNFNNTNFGITVFDGMATNQGPAYVHHGGWNSSLNGTPVPTGLGFTSADIVKSTDASGAVPVDLNTVTFTAQAGQLYTIALGGYRDGTWFDTTDGYVLNVTSSPVPVPAAVWLLGSALAGIAGLGRRRRSGWS